MNLDQLDLPTLSALDLDALASTVITPPLHPLTPTIFQNVYVGQSERIDAVDLTTIEIFPT